MKMVVAIVRTTSLDRIAKALERVGARGMTISQIKGIGEQVTLNTPYSIHDKIEILVPDDKTDEVMNIILDHVKTGCRVTGSLPCFP